MIVLFFLLLVMFYYSGLLLIVSIKFNLFGFSFVDFSFMLDKYLLVFCFALFMIFYLIVVYNSVYLDDFVYNFFIVLFVVDMFVLVSSINLLGLIIWWDFLGLISFVLIVYYNSFMVIKSGLLVCLFNRMGDLFYFFLLVTMFNLGLSIFILDYVNLIILIICLMVKSSQHPLNLWLTKAMVAPLPVSALVHSSTLVTVGFYLMFRFFVWFDMNLFLSVITFGLIFVSVSILFINDFKKMMAISTMSNLVLMMFMLSEGYNSFSFVFMIIHAFFKSMMFLVLGIFIYLGFDCQDSRLFKSMFYYNPVLSFVFFISASMMGGMFYLFVFYCKDIFFDLLMSVKLGNFFFFFFFFFFTLIYLFKFAVGFFNSDSGCVICLFSLNFFFIVVLLFLMVLSLLFIKFVFMFYFWLGNLILLGFWVKFIFVLLLFLFVFLSVELMFVSIKLFYVVTMLEWFLTLVYNYLILLYLFLDFKLLHDYLFFMLNYLFYMVFDLFFLGYLFYFFMFCILFFFIGFF